MSYTVAKLTKHMLKKSERDRPSTQSILKSKLAKKSLKSYFDMWKRFDMQQNAEVKMLPSRIERASADFASTMAKEQRDYQ